MIFVDIQCYANYFGCHITGNTNMQTPSALSSLSSMICDPLVRDAFERAERKRDDGHTLRMTNDRPRPLDGGAVERIPNQTEDQAARPHKLAVAYA
jgi:hypothetical protein